MNIKKIIIPKQIIILFSLAVILNAVRFFVFKSTYFLYMFWNLFLAVLPFIISSLMLWYSDNKSLKKPAAIIFGLTWLLLFPNAIYMITDLIHLGRSHSAPLIYDTFLIFTFAWLGLLISMHSLYHIEKMLSKKYSNYKTNLIITIIILLSSFGIYLGRFLRFNSWDVVSSTTTFFNKILDIFIRPNLHTDAYVFTLITFIFTVMAYIAWKYSIKEAKNI